MSTKKYSLLTIVLYSIVFITPAFFSLSGDPIIVTTILYFAGALLMLGLYFTQKELLSFESKENSWMRILLIGLASIYLSILLQNAVMQIEQFLGQSVGSENTQGILEIVKLQPLFIIAITIGAPVMEEFVFRRALPGLLELKMNTWLAFVISSLLFAIAHFDGHILLYFSLGMFFSLLYYVTGSIWTSIIAHAGMNALVVIVSLIFT